MATIESLLREVRILERRIAGFTSAAIAIGGGGGGTGDVVGPAASVDGEVVLYDGTTGKLLKRATGTGPAKLASGVLSAAAIDLSTGEVTGDLPFSKFVQASAGSKLVGRQSGSAGDFGEITLGANLSMSGSTLSAAITGIGQVKTAHKAADTTRNSTVTLTDDPDLTFAVAANEVYIVQATLLLDGGVTPDYKFGWSYPVGTTMNWGAVGGTPTSWEATATSTGQSPLKIETGTLGQGATSGSVVCGVILHVVVAVGANAGAVALQWAQNVSDAANTTIKAHSSLVAVRVA